MTDIGHWRQFARDAAALDGTPCYVMSASHVASALDEIAAYRSTLAWRHWLSVKTQPVKVLLEWWRDRGLGVDVVSAFELDAAVSCGLTPERILVNGAGKLEWLPRCELQGLNVHIDSVAEAAAIHEVARVRGWRIGLRCEVPGQGDPHDPTPRDQFGMTLDETIDAARLLRGSGVPISGVHFHLRTDVAFAEDFARALAHLRVACTAAAIEPEYVDVGGGLPVPGETPADGSAARSASFDLGAWAAALATVPAMFPAAREVWLENGRFMTARAGALVVTILDRKERDDLVYLICDGGRVNHARLAAFARRPIIPDPVRQGPLRRTVVCGPTCASIDRLGTYELPADLCAGDRLIWLNAGAYHIPLEARFSFGRAAVVWCDAGGAMRIVRQRETSAEWWSQWS